jgi:ComF family protein
LQNALWRSGLTLPYTFPIGGRADAKPRRQAVRCVFPGQSIPLTLDVPLSQTSAWRAIVRVLRSPADSLSCALFPCSCALCGGSLLRFTPVPICDSCCTQLPPQNGILCTRCGEDLGIARFSTTRLSGEEPGPQAGSLCQPCRMAAPAFIKAVAYGSYQGQLRSLVHLLKYEGMQPLAHYLGTLLADSLETFAVSPSEAPRRILVVPVPMHPGKQRQRGYNHAHLLARAAVLEMRRRRPQWELQLEPNMLQRTRITASQAGLTAHQRRQNLRGAFFAPHPARLAGKHVLLIDDIYTTGATARACSRVLMNAGAASVRVATVARAQREGIASWDPGFLRAMGVATGVPSAGLGT